MTIGFDLGGQNCVAAITRKNAGGGVSGGNFIDITLDEGSKRAVPPCVGFPEKERTYGAIAEKQFKKNIRNTIRQPQRLLGKDISQTEFWCETEKVPLTAGYQTAGGKTVPIMEVDYLDEKIQVAPEHAVSMMLRHQVKHCKELGINSNECCVTIPNNCSYAAREALVNAIRLADLNPLKLANSTECLALDYGLLGGKARGNEQATLFLDFGHTGVDMGVVRFFDGGWEIVGIDTCTDFSGSYLDRQMIKFFAENFEKQFGSNFLKNAKAVSKVESKLPKLKKNLVVNEVASITIDYLYDGEDFTCKISREEMWSLCEDTVAKFSEYLTNFLNSCKERLKDVKFENIELVGGVSRMVDLRSHLSNLLKDLIGNGNLQQQLNTDEAVARGCVLQCAILSPRFAIQERKVTNIVPFSVLVGRQPLDFALEEWGNCNYETLFPVWSELGKIKSITFKKPKSIRMILVEETTLGERRLIGYVDVNSENCKLKEGEKWKKFQVIVNLDNSGLLSFRVEVSRSLTELVDVAKEIEVPKTEEEYAKEVEEAKAKAQKKAEEAREKAIAAYKKKLEEREKAKAEAKPEATAEDGDGDVVMEEVKPEEELKNPEEEEMVVPEVKVSKMKKETTTEKVEKTKVLKEDVACTFISLMGMLPSTETSIRALETKQAAYDASQLAIQDARNSLESYVLEAQEQFGDGGKYFDFMSGEEAESFMGKIFEMDEYVCEDEFDKPKEEYEEKLASLTQFGDVYETRCEEWGKRPKALQMCKKLLNQIEAFLGEGHTVPEFVHIEAAVLGDLSNKCRDANLWLDERQQAHSKTNKTQNPPYFTAEISAKISEVNSAFLKVKQTPKPEPPPEEEKPEEKTENKEDAEMKDPETTEKKPEAEEDCEMAEN